MGDAVDPGGLRHTLLEAFALETRPTVRTIDLDEVLAPLCAGTVIGGRYELEARVGSGAFADVYRAKDTEVPGHVVALKLLHQASLSDEARASALRELHLIASVFHPSIVQLKDHGWHESRLWFVMPWYEGETLEARIARGPLSRPEARRIFEHLARALSAMHAVGIRHQDVKPDNILLARVAGFGEADAEEDVLPVLLDLGVAAKEAEMVVAGTPTYFAPEVAAQFATSRGRSPVTVKADVFSLALSLRNALEPSSQEDVAAGAVEAFIVRRATEPPRRFESGELRFLDPWLERWMSLEPEERPTAEELSVQLAVLTRPEERRARRIAVMRWALPLALTLVVVFASALYGLNQRAQRQKLEAERARLTAASLREDLSMSEQQKAALQYSMRNLRQSYEQGRLSRRELAGKLATAETNLGVVREDLGASEHERHALAGQLKQTHRTLASTKETLETARGEIDRTHTALSAAEAHAEGLSTQLASLRADLASARDDAAQARRHGADLDGQVAALHSELRGGEGQGRAAHARHGGGDGRAGAGRERLAEARRRIARLERQIAERMGIRWRDARGRRLDQSVLGQHERHGERARPVFRHHERPGFEHRERRTGRGGWTGHGQRAGEHAHAGRADGPDPLRPGERPRGWYPRLR